MPDEAEAECSRRSHLDSLSENDDEFYDAQVDTEALVKDGLTITPEFKEENGLKDSTMVINNGAKCNVLRCPLIGTEMLINPIRFSYIVDSSRSVDHETFKPRASPTSRLVDQDSSHCNDEDDVLSFSKDSRYLLTTGKNKTLIIWVNEDQVWRKDITIFNDAAVSSACFSPDSRYMIVHTSVGVKIYSLRNGNKWEERCAIKDYMRATCSPDRRHLAIYNSEVIEIWNLGMNGVIGDTIHGWYTNIDLNTAYFTTNSSYLIVTCYNEPNKIFGLESNGNGYWERKSSIQAKGKDTLLTATIWNDDLYIGGHQY
ncbi:MAG: WD40 repeat domain-containing protein [Candidatus Endonucleobacter bathymodioli]|uniref:WD40 repeat domain-containing protein n=1 Tax=Candidatus Endonucleibacter bathymodioli TaxID=539814 RepID=A0AA90SU23_9GAMM|nr:WD40 repeat domain-containing protein [Candidatus Endonucleobacter bathymodioli]